MPNLTEQQAYWAMFSFLEGQWESNRSDYLGALLGSMSLLADGSPADSAHKYEWQSAVQAALSGHVPAGIALKKVRFNRFVDLTRNCGERCCHSSRQRAPLRSTHGRR